MALWQYGFYILPSGNIEGRQMQRQEDNYFDDSFYWQAHKTDCEVFNSIEVILRKLVSWNKNLLIFRSDSSNILEVLCEDNIVTSVSFRIDFTSRYEHILNEIIEFCIFNGLSILDEDLNIMPLNFEIARSKIENSPQVKKYNKLSNQ